MGGNNFTQCSMVSGTNADLRARASFPNRASSRLLAAVMREAAFSVDGASNNVWSCRRRVRPTVAEAQMSWMEWRAPVPPGVGRAERGSSVWVVLDLLAPPPRRFLGGTASSSSSTANDDDDDIVLRSAASLAAPSVLNKRSASSNTTARRLDRRSWSTAIPSGNTYVSAAFKRYRRDRAVPASIGAPRAAARRERSDCSRASSSSS
mmetsp:Transcript_41301/g.124975  ORF Transcript_41301/g.124975 Transcript_41301/m.124975 type:complete len:207 (+) Transcript_41301:607-1227(+)